MNYAYLITPNVRKEKNLMVTLKRKASDTLTESKAQDPIFLSDQHTCREKIPSFSTVFTWETMLSSIQSTVIGILAPHLSHSAVIPHLTPIAPVLLELGVITPGLASITRLLASISLSPTTGSAQKLRWWGASSLQLKESRRRRERMPLEAADIATEGRYLRVSAEECSGEKRTMGMMVAEAAGGWAGGQSGADV